MKLSSLLTLLFSLLLVPAEAQTRYDTIQYAKEHYQQRRTTFKDEVMTKGKIIFLGNSLIEFGDWNKLLNDPTVSNRGIAGDNTFGVLNRLDEVIARQPKKLFLEIGVNDIGQNIPADIIVKNILSIVDKILIGSPKTKIYLISILPTNNNTKDNFPDHFNKNEIVSLVNKKTKSEAKGRYTYVDLNKKISDQNGQLDVRYADADGLHLNEDGYKLWVSVLRELDNTIFE